MASQVCYYDEGETAVLTMTFTDPADGVTPKDPATVQFSYQPKGTIPATPTTLWTYGGAGTITKLTVGSYQVAIPMVVTNGAKQQRYECSWDSIGSWAGAKPFAIVITAKNV